MTSHNSKTRTTLSEINVTPLVDVMLVLLIIFMVTAPMMQQGIQVELPKTSSSGVGLNEEPFILVIEKNGDIKISDTSVSLSNLKEKLIGIFEVRKDKQVYIQADRRVTYDIVAKTMGEIKAAGIPSIGLVTEPKTK